MTPEESRRRGLDRLFHLAREQRERTTRLAEERERIERLRSDSAAPRVVSAFNLFQTPEPLAAVMACRLGPPFGRTLEPSAGLGRLYRAVRRQSKECHMTLVDVSPECCGELYRATEGDPNTRLVQGDFLTMDAERLGGEFSTIIMNPPFKHAADIKHIEHAANLLVPGGLLIALCANGPRQNAKLKPLAATWTRLPAKTFAGEGTNVDAVLLTIRGKLFR